MLRITSCLQTFDYASRKCIQICESQTPAQIAGLFQQAASSGFAACLLLTPNRVAACQQLFSAMKEHLETFCVCGENDGVLFEHHHLESPTLVVLKKHPIILKHWANIFRSSGILDGNPLFLVDVSRQSKKNRRPSKLDERIREIIRLSASSIYLHA